MKKKKIDVERETVLVRIWDSLEEINAQLTSDLAEGFTFEELEKFDAAIAGVLKKTTSRFNKLLEERAGGRKKQGAL